MYVQILQKKKNIQIFFFKEKDLIESNKYFCSTANKKQLNN